MTTLTTPTTPLLVQPCLDFRCAIHGRGADPARASRLTCARQVLRAYDRVDAIALLEQEMPLPDAGAQRVLLPFHSSPLAGGQSERVVPPLEGSPRRQIHAFRAERIVLSADASWRVDDVLLDGRSQLGSHGRLPAELFGSGILGGVSAFDRIGAPIDVAVLVSRVAGSEPAVLVGAILGSATYEPRALAVRSDGRVSSGSSVEVRVECGQSVEVHRLVIEQAGEWILHDIAVDGTSLLAQRGDLPGDVFSSDAIDNFVRFGVVRAGSRVEIQATYIGWDPDGQPFVGELRGQEPDPESEPE